MTLMVQDPSGSRNLPVANAAANLRDALRAAIVAARDTAPHGAGRLARCNDSARGRSLDLRGVAACVDELVKAGADREKVEAIGHAFQLWIIAQLPAPAALGVESLTEEAHYEGAANEATSVLGFNSSCRFAWARAKDALHRHRVALDRAIAFVSHREREVAR